MKKFTLIFSILSSLLLLYVLFFIHVRGFIPYDEGWFLQGGLRLLNNDKVYKDFQFLYNPAGLYVNAFAFFIFGKTESARQSRRIDCARTKIGM